ncbi:MAG TPA: PD-(D/E)XK nuclease-like domain-containing protein [Gammaproteobacteria bacterium]|jgi:exodeoxyribonuclease VIII|nr:PD-(D/E)XK nuclease-like domain-containing protein [Gammaproteobacteria bacterium]
MTPGIYEIPNEEYHASIGISRSKLSLLKQSPLRYWYNYLSPNPPPKEHKDCFDFGTLLHTLVLEPHLFDGMFFPEEKYDRRTNIGKEKHEEYMRRAEGKIIIAPDDILKAQEMARVAKEHPHVISILNGADIEKSLYWTDTETTTLCKARPDIWNRQINILADLKTSRYDNAYDFMREAEGKDYHMQAAMQIDSVFELTGDVIDHFVFLVVPKEPPYMPYTVPLDDETIEQGRKVYKSGLKLLKHCIETNEWDKERVTLRPYSLTPWQMSRNPFNELLEVYCG